jgi:hypothetical protein
LVFLRAAEKREEDVMAWSNVSRREIVFMRADLTIRTRLDYGLASPREARNRFSEHQHKTKKLSLASISMRFFLSA